MTVFVMGEGSWVRRANTRDELRVTCHARLLVAAALCLLLAACGLIEIGVSNSPDWCPKPDSKGCL